MYELGDFRGFPKFSCVIRKLKYCMDWPHLQSRALEGPHESERLQNLNVTAFSANAHLIGLQGRGAPLPTHSLPLLLHSLSPSLPHSLFSALPSWFSPSVHTFCRLPGLCTCWIPCLELPSYYVTLHFANSRSSFSFAHLSFLDTFPHYIKPLTIKFLNTMPLSLKTPDTSVYAALGLPH